jgi:hypothetical protein
MSPSTATARTRPQREVESHRPSLRLVATRPLTAARLPFAIFIGAILSAGLVALLLLHTMAAQDAFRLQALQHESAALDDTEQQLAVANQRQAAPATLGARARALGMVATGSIAYVDLHHHGKVVGVVRAAEPPPPPAPSASPSPSPSASASPAAASKQVQTHKKPVKTKANRRVTQVRSGQGGRLKP